MNSPASNTRPAATGCAPWRAASMSNRDGEREQLLRAAGTERTRQCRNPADAFLERSIRGYSPETSAREKSNSMISKVISRGSLIVVACTRWRPPRRPRPAKLRAPACCWIASPPRSTKAWCCRASSRSRCSSSPSACARRSVELPPQNVLRAAGARPSGAAGIADAARQPRRHQGVRRNAEQRARRRRQAEQHQARGSARCARRPGHRLRRLSRAAAQGARDADPAPARRDLAHQREPARDRAVPRAAEENAVGGQRVQRLAHPDRRAAGGHARKSSTRRRRRPKRFTRRRPVARTSRASRCNSRTPRPRSRAARSAGARAGAADVPRRAHRGHESRRRDASRCARRPAITSSSSTTCGAARRSS